MPKRRDLPGSLSKDDPNYELVGHFRLEGWADSNGLVADVLAGRTLFSDWIRGCVKTFGQAAEVQVALEDTTPTFARCKEVDAMAKKFVRKFRERVTSESSRLGEDAVSEAIGELSRDVNEIAARSKQRILLAELARRTLSTDLGKSMNITPQQKDLLFAIVDAHGSGYGSRFVFMRSHSGSALTYPPNRNVRVDADEVDLSLLERERFIIILARDPGPLIAITGQPTELGIATVVSLRDPVAPSGGPASSRETISEGLTTHLPSWKDLQADFLQYAVEHSDLRAEWTWAYTHTDRSAQLPPHGEWTFQGPPGSQHLFKAVARRTADRLPDDPSGAEPWRLWLDLMREGYARKVLPRRLSTHQFRMAVESGGYLPLPPGFENHQIANVFKASADFCHVRSLGERSAMVTRTDIRNQDPKCTLTFLDINHPKFMYHATKPPVQVFSEQQQAELGPEWSETYIFQAYPKCKYYRTGETVTVKDADAEAALGEGWGDSPDGPFGLQNADPFRWFDAWGLECLDSEARGRIRAVLANAHADVIDSGADYDSKVRVASMRNVFGLVADEYLHAGLLTESMLEASIQQIAYDAAVSGGWQTGTVEKNSRCTLQFGSYWVPESVPKMLRELFEAQVWRWRGKLAAQSRVATDIADRFADSRDSASAKNADSLEPGPETSADAPVPSTYAPRREERAAPKDDHGASRRSPKEIVDASRRNPKRSYVKFAARIGIGKDTLYAITKQTRWVSDETYELVAQICNCKPEDLHPRSIPPPDGRR